MSLPAKIKDMDLSVYKSSPRATHPYSHPSALWAVREMPGLVLAKEWLPDMKHHDWIILFDEFIPVERGSGPISISPEELHRSETIYRAMSEQRFPSRQDALQALSAACIIHI